MSRESLPTQDVHAGESACCNVCHVYYEPGYAGPCQEFARSATDDQIVAGTARRCPGTVSLAAAVDVQRDRAVKAEAEVERLRGLLLDKAGSVPLVEHATMRALVYVAYRKDGGPLRPDGDACSTSAEILRTEP